jgi:2-polyprenyl-6-hydroxyphenyl methylase / 3-demethylubiquinone-9 3-methyltransferase
MNIDSTVDKKEVAKFSKLADQWWDMQGEFKILHQINPIRIEYIISKITRHFDAAPAQNLKILDIGCGGGIASCALYQNGFDVTGIDASRENIEIAKTYAATNNFKINYIHTTTSELIYRNNLQSCHPELDSGSKQQFSEILNQVQDGGVANSLKKYDVILALEVIEHVADVDIFLSEIRELLADGGMIIISTINRTPKAYALAILMGEYILGWAPRGTHEYKKFAKPSEIHSIITKKQLAIKELKGLVFNLATGNWELSNNIDVNYFAYITRHLCLSVKV